MKQDRLLDLREMKRVPADMGSVRLDGTFEGYASIFNEVDLGNDVVAPGAFTASLAQRGPSGIRMLFQHDAAEPIGTWEKVEETPQGLKVRGRLALATQKGREVHELMRASAIDGLSIGFRTIRARQDRTTGARRILEADLWEISVVTFPMQESARVDNVKRVWPGLNQDPALPSIREFERWLVRDAGLSRSDARRVITKGYRNCLNRRDAAGSSPGMPPGDLAAHIRAAASLLHNGARHTNPQGC